MYLSLFGNFNLPTYTPSLYSFIRFFNFLLLDTQKVLVIGIAQIYLPYYADRDKLRGLFEEDMSQKARREMELIQKEEQRKSKAYATSIDQQKAKKV